MKTFRCRTNLPNLEYLDLAYNSLKAFDFDYLDQVGSLSILRVNVSHNQIGELRDNTTYALRDHGGSFYHCNVKWLDLSYNNISNVYSGYFRPAEMSLTHLYLGNNQFKRLFKDTFGSLHHLQWLDLSRNLITDIDPETFRNTKRLQVVHLSGNFISELPADLFRYSRVVRIINLSHNTLRLLPENVFGGDGMEDLDLSYNLLSKVPATSLSNLAALTLNRLSLRHNSIANIQSIDLSNKFRSLSWLDLSHNQLIRLEDAAFATLPRLNYLDLSYNLDLEINPRAFIGLENSLLELHLQNISLDFAPELPIQKLQHLNLAFNEMPTIPQQFAENLTHLRTLDLSYNDLTIVPEMVKYLPNIRSLSLAGNPITILTNATFGGISEELAHLNVANLELHELETGALSFNLPYLRTIHFSAYPAIATFNIPKVIEGSENLRTLVLHGPFKKAVDTPVSLTGGLMGEGGVMDIITGGSSPSLAARVTPVQTTDFGRELTGEFPAKVRELKIVGSALTKLSDVVLKGVRSPVFNLVIQNTSIVNLPDFIFRDLENVRNITLDFSHENTKMKKVPSPNSANFPNEDALTYLNDLEVAGMELACTCDLGWVEFWQRKTRQYVCTSQQWTERMFKPSNRPLYEHQDHSENLCDEHGDELRAAKCSNKNNRPLLEVLKSELECGWGSRASTLETVLVLVVFGTAFLTVLI